MTLSYWNKQFQFSKLLPDFQNCLDGMQTRSESIADVLSLQRHAYGRHPRQWVELFGQPTRGNVLPVFIHGGYWRALEAERHRFVLPPLKTLNGAVANVEYRLMPEVGLKDIVEDACAALQLLKQQTGCQLFPIGHSAGGHLAVMAARLLPDDVVGAMAISGLYELEPLHWSFLRDEIGLTTDSFEGCEPQKLWAGHDASHLVLAVGANETSEFHRQAQVFAASHGAQVMQVPGAHHMTVLDDLAQTDGVLLAVLRALDPFKADPDL